MDFVLVGGIAGAAINGGDVTLTLPAMQQGDIVVVAGGHVLRAGHDPTIGSGDYTTTPYTGGSTGQLAAIAGYKIMGPVPDSTVVCGGTGNANDTSAYVAMVFRGEDQATPLDVAIVATTAQPSSANPVPPAITTVTDGAAIVVFAQSSVNDTTVTAPTGYGDLTNAGGTDVNSLAAAAAWKILPSHGLETPDPFTNWSSGGWAACTVALRPFLPAPSGGGGSTGAGGRERVSGRRRRRFEDQPLLYHPPVRRPWEKADAEPVAAPPTPPVVSPPKAAPPPVVVAPLDFSVERRDLAAIRAELAGVQADLDDEADMLDYIDATE